MSTQTDEIEFDDDVPTVEDAPSKTAKDHARAAFARWQRWPLWARIVSVPVGLYAGFIVLAFVLGVLGSLLGFGGGDDETTPEPVASAPTSTTTVASDPLSGLPTVAPLVASNVRPEDRAEFANRVRTVTADGTSLCDVFFGVGIVQQGDGTTRAKWSITTPAMQQRSGVGVQLPSAEWPVRAFYGAPCDVIGTDATLPAPSAVTVSTLPAGVTGE